MPKIQIGNENLTAALKTKKQGVKLEPPFMEQVRSKIKEVGLEGPQELFDYLIVSGVIYLKKEIIEIVDNSKSEYERKKAKTGEGKKKNIYIFFMYPPDYQALNRFCMEKNIKKFWLIEMLFNLFVNGDQRIHSHIEECQRLNLNERKKQVARLLKDEYVDILPENDADQLLGMFTEKYDKKEFGNQIQEEVLKFVSRKKEEESRKHEEDIEAALDAKAKRIAQARLRRLVDPIR